MTWNLEVQDGPSRGKKAAITGGSVTIGRDQSRCSLVLTDEKVSRLHARVTLDASGTITIEDQVSTHGTFVNGKEINAAVNITEDDSITIGDTHIVLTWLPEAVPAGGIAEENQYISAITIGREASNDLVIENPEVSRSHARLERRADGYYLSDLDSSHGTRLNGQKISGTVALPASSWINIRGHNFFFNGEKLVTEQGATAASFAHSTISKSGSMALLDIISIPFKGREALKWLLGSILSVIPIISFFADGYRYKIYQNGLTGSLAMPEWEDWKNLFVKGFFFFLVKAIYLLPPSFLFYFLILMAANSPGITPGLFFASLIPGILLLIAATLILPISWGRFAASGNFGDAFQFSAIISSIKAVLNQYLSAVAVVIGLWIFIGLISLIPFIGFVFSIMGSFFIYIVSAMLFGQVYRQSQSSA